jgi:hypothetical protein
MRHVYTILVGKPKGKRLIGRPTYRCGNKIKIKVTVFWNVVPCSVAVYEHSSEDT